MGETAHEVPRIREAGDHPPGRAIPPPGPSHLGISWGSPQRRFTAGMSGIEPSPRPGLKTAPAAPAGCGRIPDDVRRQIVDLALDEPELSPRESVTFTDTRGYFVSDGDAWSKPAQGPRPASSVAGSSPEPTSTDSLPQASSNRKRGRSRAIVAPPVEPRSQRQFPGLLVRMLPDAQLQSLRDAVIANRVRRTSATQPNINQRQPNINQREPEPPLRDQPYWPI